MALIMELILQLPKPEEVYTQDSLKFALCKQNPNVISNTLAQQDPHNKPNFVQNKRINSAELRITAYPKQISLISSHMSTNKMHDIRIIQSIHGLLGSLYLSPTYNILVIAPINKVNNCCQSKAILSFYKQQK